MSRYEWQQGEFKLPSAEFTRLRKLMEETDRKFKEEAFALTQTFWTGLTRKQQTDPEEYRRALDEFTWRDYRDGERIFEMFNSMPMHVVGGKPARVKKGDVDWPTNRTLKFGAGEAVIAFNKETSSATFSIPENNHAIERASGHPVMAAFKKALPTVRWTRGTGGRIWSGDEYQRDADREHGSSSDPTGAAFGPIGAADYPFQTQPWQDPKGDWYHAETKVVRGRPQTNYLGGFQGRVAKGRPAGGQFTSRYYSDDNISLNF